MVFGVTISLSFLSRKCLADRFCILKLRSGKTMADLKRKKKIKDDQTASGNDLSSNDHLFQDYTTTEVTL